MHDDPSKGISFTTANAARRYDYWLGGKDNFAADRASGDAIERAFPHIRTAAVQNRRFLHRVVRYLAAGTGIRQFLDIGTGLPSMDNTHEIAQRVDPGCRVVYVDNDPVVMAHARALLTSSPQGRTSFIEADLREPRTILTAPDLHRTLNWDEPVAVLLVAVLHFVDDTELVYAAVKTLVDALPAGSFLALSHATEDLLDVAPAAQPAGGPVLTTGVTTRTHEQVARFFDGLDLIAPGLTAVSDWRPDPDSSPPPQHHVPVYGGLARLPPRRNRRFLARAGSSAARGDGPEMRGRPAPLTSHAGRGGQRTNCATGTAISLSNRLTRR